MQIRSLLLAASFTVVLVSPALAQSEQASLVDFNHGDERSDGTVQWRTEIVKTPDGRDDLAIRADVEVPNRNMNLKLLLRRNLDPSVPASHLIEMTFKTPPDFIDGGALQNAFAVSLEPKEMSASGDTLLGTSYKMTTDGEYVEALSNKPADICKNLAVLTSNVWLEVLLNGAKRKPNVFLPVADQTLWFSKGKTGQLVFDAVFAAWDKTPGLKGAVCQPS